MTKDISRALLTTASLLLTSACAVGPDYVRPAVTTPSAFKEAPVAMNSPLQGYSQPVKDQGGSEPSAPAKAVEASAAVATPQAIDEKKTDASAAPAADAPAEAKALAKAQPCDDKPRGKWWEVFKDADLNTLEEQVAQANQTVKAAEATFREERALVAEARSAYFPTLGADASMSRGSSGSGSRGDLNSNPTASVSSHKVNNSYNASLEASWVPDFWGKVRRQVESSKATAQASAADLASAILTEQGDLAVDYFGLRIADAQKQILADTAAAYTRSLKITENQYRTGVAAQSDVLQAKVQLESVQAQQVDVEAQRAEFEHAIAVLIGKAPAEFSLADNHNVPGLPLIPVSLPSELLQRRPDIASAERQVAAANANIGVVEAAFFPDITLAASGGFTSSQLAKWFTLPYRYWSIGPSLAETIFDAGLRSAQTEAAIASYDQTAANYRQTVLNAFQEVEDNLASLRVFAQEAEVLDTEVKDSDRTVQIVLNEYKAGTVSYLNVVTAQAAALNAKLADLNVNKSRLVDSATLIEDLGGGWDVSKLDDPAVTQGETTPFSFFPPLHAHQE